MEEILASIRRIIADDQVLPLSRPLAEAPQEEVAAAPEPAPAPVAAPARPLLNREPMGEQGLREQRSQPPIPRAPRPSLGRPEAVEQPQRPAARFATGPAVTPEPEPLPLVSREEGALLSPNTDARLASSFNALSTTVMLQEGGMIEDGVKELLRPMLKQWLDDNLPAIVEKLVRAEIERVARGNR
jgi:cell pole-organizing protein PopZ